MEQRPTDWQCPNTSCMNHMKMVFGTKTHCPKCGTANGEDFHEGGGGGGGFARAETGMQGGDMPGDWMCPNTNCINNSKLVFGKNSACPKCGTARNAKMPGDWRCPNAKCSNHTNMVFASKPSCPKCGSPRPGTMGQPMGRMPQPALASFPGAAMPVMQQGQLGRPDDWQCPNASCLNHSKMVFGKNASCPKCGSPKPAGSPLMGGALGALMQGMGMMGGMSQPMQPIQPMQMIQPVHQQQQLKPGDWQCPDPSCLNHGKMVFGKHASCPKCGMPKPDVSPMMGGAMGSLMQSMGMNMGGMGMGGAMAAPMPRGRGGSNPGDWRCPNADCQNHRTMVFAKHQSCPKCGTEKPFMGFDAGSMDRSRSPHGRMPGMMTGSEIWG